MTPSAASAFADSPASSLSLPTIETIFEALSARRKLLPRESQIRLAEQVRDTLGMGGVCCVEAPTGTGKTLGYLAGALDFQAHAANPLPVVVATATVNLQEQIVRHDIPRLIEAGVLTQGQWAIAKGRGRYFCPRTAAVLEDKKMRDNQLDMFQPDKHVAEGGTQIALDMLKAWREGEWTGDQDSWQGTLPGCWASTCAASSDTCVGRVCEHYAKCPYMQSRQKMGHAQLIIANHDLVLADLAQRADEQPTTALPSDKYALIFDEAHNLPEKAVGTRRASARLFDTDWLRKLEEYGSTIGTTAKVDKALARSASPDVFQANAALLRADMERWSGEVNQKAKFDMSGVFSWGLKKKPQPFFREGVIAMASRALDIVQALKTVAKALSEVAEDSVGADKSHAVRLLAATYRYQRMASDLQRGLEFFSSDDNLVRWATRNRDNQVTLHTQPLEGSEVLTHLLWSTGFPVALVSATLQLAGSFDRFRDKTGLPGHAVCKALAPVFDYERGFLHLPPMATTPGESGYETEVALKIETLFRANAAPGMLVLFTSRETMRRVAGVLADDVRSALVLQDGSPVPELVARHKSHIDQGRRSILCGLDSMSEGLDLPGKYCGHVVITRLPFAVPGDPVEEARRQALGAAWFEKAYLADMVTALIQATGRLIRREDDHGVISVLDKRLYTKRYSNFIYAALPEFMRGPDLQTYFDTARLRGFDLSHGVTARPAASPAVVSEPLKPKNKLSLAHSGPGGGAELSQESAETKAPAPVSAPPSDPLASLRRAKQKPCETGKPSVRLEQETVFQQLARLHPVARGPFADHEVPYLACAQPCLPAGASADTWAERLMPEAVALGLLWLNREWDETAAPWLRVLCLRPDALQFADVLRSHLEPREDARKACLPAKTCHQQLVQVFSGPGALTKHELVEAVKRIEAEVAEILAGPHRLPTRDLLLSLVDGGTRLGAALRACPAKAS